MRQHLSTRVILHGAVGQSADKHDLRGYEAASDVMLDGCVLPSSVSLLDQALPFPAKLRQDLLTIP